MKILKSCIYVALLSILVIAESNAFDYSNQVHIKSSGEKLKSTDGGKTWRVVPIVKQDYSLQKMINSAGEIYKFTDWGKTWKKQANEKSDLNISNTKNMCLQYLPNEKVLKIALTAAESTSAILTISSIDGTIIKRVQGLLIQKGNSSIDLQINCTVNSKYFAVLEVGMEIFSGSFTNIN